MKKLLLISFVFFPLSMLAQEDIPTSLINNYNIHVTNLFNQDREKSKQNNKHSGSLEGNEYIDLGLPSGTLWKSSNEKGGPFTYNDAIKKFNNQIPSEIQMHELFHSCLWIQTGYHGRNSDGNGYKIIGTNGNSIYISNEVMKIKPDETELYGPYFWTSTLAFNGERAVIFTPNETSFASKLIDEVAVRLILKRPTQKDTMHPYDHHKVQDIKIMNQIYPPNEKDYVDLGLPSGTLWCSSNEIGLYDHYESKKRFKNQLPTVSQWDELIEKCTWTWTGRGYKITGCNGNSVFLPTTGWRNYYGDGKVCLVDSIGVYWSYGRMDLLEEFGFEKSRGLNFDSEFISTFYDRCNSERAVRLVNDNKAKY